MNTSIVYIKRADGSCTECRTCAELKAALGCELFVLEQPTDHHFLLKLSNIDMEKTARKAGMVRCKKVNGIWIIKESPEACASVKLAAARAPSINTERYYEEATLTV